MTATKKEGRSLLSSSGERGRFKDYDAISHYCEEKASDWSSIHRVGSLGTPADSPDSCLKENVVNFGADANCDIQQLLTKSQALHASPSKSGSRARASAPEKKYVFQDKKNFGGKRVIDTKKKKNDEGKLLRQKVARSEKRIAGLQDVLKRKDEQLLETQSLAGRKDKELEEMSDFVSTLENLLQEIACEGTTNIDQAAIFPHSSALSDDHDTNALQASSSKEQQHDISGLKERISHQGSVIDSLKSLNMNSEQTISSLTELISEKEQALAEMSHFSDMNDCANKELLNHAHEKHQEAVREAQTEHKREAFLMSENNAQLLTLSDSLKDLNMNLSLTVNSLMQLIDEKDKALAEISHFNAMNDCANERLLSHTRVKHEEEIREHEMRTRYLLTEKYSYQQELALIKLKIMEDGCKVDSQYVRELKFALTTLVVVTVLMVLVWQQDRFFFVAPIYFLFVFFNLE